jgi:hypothetical protein
VPAKEGRGMTPDTFDNALRRVAAGGTRRAAMAALVGAALAAFSRDEGAARKFRDQRTWRKSGKRKKGKEDKKRRKDKKRKKSKSKNKKNKGTSKGCKVKHSEKQILDFIAKAAKKYGQSNKAMVRVARCESSLNPCAYNKGGPYFGLYQFLKSTWKTTPYKDKSIYDPEAQALAAGWMWKQGRKNEWACQ